jgi:cyclohexa-1,5-dienecarbonyl-CoA hydratase
MTTSTGSAVAAERGAVRIVRDGAVVRLVLDHPPLNVLTIAMLEELHGVLGELAADDSVKLVTLSGNGRAFCAGVDVADHAEDRVTRMLELFHGALLRLHRLPCPTVAVAHGAALGGGCELLLACDLVLAREDLKVGQPEIRLGVFPPFAAAILPQLVGRQRAMELVLTGCTLSAAEAHAAGLVTRVYPDIDFDTAVQEYLSQLVRLSGPVQRLAKRAVAECAFMPLTDAVAHTEALYANDLLQLHDAHEGLTAFMEKRVPVWREA